MHDRRPVTDLDDLYSLDEADMVEGYCDGRDGWPCDDNRSRAYWHGWRNGMVDSGRMAKDDAMAVLARKASAVTSAMGTDWNGTMQ